MILAEQLLLLSLDPDRGMIAKGVSKQALEHGACAAILSDLVLSRRVARRGRGVALLDNLPDFNPFLETAGRAMSGGEQSIADAVDKIRRSMRRLNRRILRSLVARDVLHDYRMAFFWHRYPVRSMQALREVFDRLYEVARSDEPSPHALALSVVAERCGVLQVRTTTDERARVLQRLETLRTNPDASAVDFSLLLQIGDQASER